MKDGQTIGQWLKWDFKGNGDLIIYGKNERPIYLEGSDGFWAKYEHDSQGNRIFYEDSSGEIIDNRVQTITYEGRKYQLIP